MPRLFVAFVSILLISAYATGAERHVVAKGDTLTSIADKYGVTVEELTRANQLRDADAINPGQTLIVPSQSASSMTHKVKKGETLSSIAKQYGVGTNELAGLNGIRNADVLQPGQELQVPLEQLAYVEHTVARGETVAEIATRYNVTVNEIVRANLLRNANLVNQGQKLIIPVTPRESVAAVSHKVRSGETLSSIADKYHITVADVKALNPGINPRKLSVGQEIIVPTSGEIPEPPPPEPKKADPRRTLPSSVTQAIDSAKVKKNRWKHIVIHHSATKEGSGKGMDRYHREDRHMENGLAYHFVIGNGNGMGDGEIFVGRRWKEQLDGGHLASLQLNEVSLGICLVGDFQKTVPTTRQLNALEALIRALQDRTRLGDSAVTTHKLIHPKHTHCPGKRFPIDEFKKRLAEP